MDRYCLGLVGCAEGISCKCHISRRLSHAAVRMAVLWQGVSTCAAQAGPGSRVLCFDTSPCHRCQQAASLSSCHLCPRLPTGVLLLAATNRPGALDPALLRPGRLDVQLYVPPPDAQGRRAILSLHCAGMPLASDVDLDSLADSCLQFTGAELAGLCREAALAALREDLAGAQAVAARHFAAARAAVAPALTASDLAKYEAWGSKYSR